MLGWNNQNEIVFVNDLNMKAWIPNRQGDDAKLNLTIQDQRDGFRTLRPDDVECDPGILPLELGNQQRQNVECRGVVGAPYPEV